MPQQRDWQTSDILPVLPRGIVLFESLPLRAVNIEALGPTIDSGMAVVRAPSRLGVVLFHSGAVIDAYTAGQDTARGDDALRRLREWHEATLSAHRLDAQTLEALPVLLSGTLVYDDLHLEWIDWPHLVNDIRGRQGTFVIEITTPDAGGAIAWRDGVEVIVCVAGTAGTPLSLDALVATGVGTVRVRQSAAASANQLDTAMVHLFGQVQPVITREEVAAQQEPRAAARQLALLAPELKALARHRLHRSSDRVERLLDAAVARGDSLETVAAAVGETPIRGVTQTSMRALADQMRDVAQHRLLDQAFLPA